MPQLATRSGDVISVHKKPPRHCHKMIRDVAKEFAGEVYETKASRDMAFFTQWPDQKAFIERCWGNFVDEARTTLAQTLATSTDEDLKKRIYDALLLDNNFRHHRR